MTRTLAALLLLAGVAHAEPPPIGSQDAAIMHDFSEWVETQYSASGQWCCSISDGRPLADDEIRPAGDHYQILYSSRHWRPSERDQGGTDAWIDVPPQAVLRQLSPV